MNSKQVAGERAVEYLEDGMLLGLGTGSTVYWSLLKLGELVKRGVNVSCIATLKKTEALATQLAIPLGDISTGSQLDLTIDSADAVDENLNLIKGGGGALFREKLVASISHRVLVVVDDSKCVSVLGGVPLPVEIVPFGWNITRNRISELGGAVTLRTEKGVPFITDNGNYILDCTFNAVSDPEQLEKQLNAITGVVENGLFVAMADMVVIGGQDGSVVTRHKISG